MDIRKIKKLAELLEESNLAEIEIHENDESVRLTRYASAPPAAPVAMAQAPVPAPAPAPASAPAAEAGDASDQTEQVPDGHMIRSPMVGTFYAAPSPDSENFVSVGQEIKAGDPVCIIEAMKLMNELEAEITGEVVEILVENAEPVEFGQPLMRVKTS